MPGSFIETDLDQMYDTNEFAVTAIWGDRTFAVLFFLQDSPADFWGNIVENAEAYIIARTKHVGDIAHGVLVTIGSVSDTGTGLAGDLFIDITDSNLDLSGIHQYYVIGKKYYGDNGLEMQIFLSGDKP